MKTVEVPDFLRTAIRQGTGVALTVCTGYIFFEPLTGAAQPAVQPCKIWLAAAVILNSHSRPYCPAHVTSVPSTCFQRKPIC